MKPIYAIPIILISLASALIIGLRNRPANNGQPPMAEWEREAWGGTTCDFCHKNLDPDNKMDGIWAQYVSCGKCAKKHHLKQ
jgi:hypothetical protein